MKLVVSAVNFSEGGPLTVLRDCLVSARKSLPGGSEIVALVHSKDLLAIPGVQFIEFPNAKKSWFKRLYLEYFAFKRISREVRPNFWLSLHDVSPRLNGEPQAVYCHNPLPFFRLTARDVVFDPSLLLFQLIYPFFYRFNIGSNRAVIVQQDWLRAQFSRRMGASHVIVAHPSVSDLQVKPERRDERAEFRLFFPTVSRSFKNIEVLCEAIRQVPRNLPRIPILEITISGDENRYARYIFKRYRDVPGIRFVGRLNRSQVAERYANCDALVFPSRIETWGLPLTEARQLDIPILAADEPYARETVGSYHSAAFLPASESTVWAQAIARAAKGEKPWRVVEAPDPSSPFAANWDELWPLLLPEIRSELPPAVSSSKSGMLRSK